MLSIRKYNAKLEILEKERKTPLIMDKKCHDYAS